MRKYTKILSFLLTLALLGSVSPTTSARADISYGTASDFEDTDVWEELPEVLGDVTITDASSSDDYTGVRTNELEWSYDYPYEDLISGFQIYRSYAPDQDFVLIDTVTNATFYADTNVKFGVTYYYKIVAFAETERGTLYSSGAYTNALDFQLDQPYFVSITSVKGNALKLKWRVTDYTEFFHIYRSDAKDGPYTLVGTKTISKKLTSDDSVTYTDTDLKMGKTYYYKICAAVSENGQTYEGVFSKIKSCQVRPLSTQITSAKSAKPRTNTITWKKVDDASGYIIYCSTKNKKNYKKLKVIKGNKKFTYTHKKRTNGVKYNYIVYAYQNTADYGKVLSYKSDNYEKYCDYYTYEKESFESKAKRMFGKASRILYKSNAQAKKHMTTITIRVWDRSGGKWFTRKFYLTVHKSLAPSVKKMFEEIYHSKSRFPIHDIGCYSWRGAGSYSEHCIGAAFDINSNENYMIDNGVVLAGSFWKPKSNQYSIPLKCELVNIMKKYGFYRGFWGNRKDYMHFSYFGT